MVLFLVLSLFPIPLQAQAAATDIIINSSTSLTINEIMYDLPGADDKHEWVEIKNTGTESVEIITGSGANSWRFFDGSNHTFTLVSKTSIIPAGGYAILADDTTVFLVDYPDFQGNLFKVSLSLNNDTDTLKLSADKGKTWFSEVIYTQDWGASGDGRTLEKEAQNWHISSQMGGTPGKENSEAYKPEPLPPPPTPLPQPIENIIGNPLPPLALPNGDEESDASGEEKPLSPTLISIKEARDKAKGEEVLIEGTVVAEPNLLGKRIFYIQDATSGIQVYLSKGDLPKLKQGQKVKILGDISEYYQEKRIKIFSAQDITQNGESEIKPLAIKTSEAGENLEGRLVEVKGEVVETSGSTFYLDDGSGKLKIYLKESAAIEKPKFKKGFQLSVSGILSQYKETYRLLPRQTEDINILENEAEGGEETAAGEGAGKEKTAGDGEVKGETVAGESKSKLAKKTLAALVGKPQNKRFNQYFLWVGGIILLGVLAGFIWQRKEYIKAEAKERLSSLAKRWRKN